MKNELYLDIVLNIPLNQAFTYSFVLTDENNQSSQIVQQTQLELAPEKKRSIKNKPSSTSKSKQKAAVLLPSVGKRADIKFGNRATTGFIVAVHETFPETCAVPREKVRPITRVIDKEPLFDEELFSLASWVSRYYLCSIGEAVFAMIPSGRRESGAAGFSFSDEVPELKARELSDEQQNAVNGILSPYTNHFHYLYGTTGSGKTEVFLQAAEKVIAQKKGVIYLVPEIGLTPQVVEAVVQRFGDTVAVLHSARTPSERLSEWRRIMNREARIVIGARSAVFAPVPDLGLIIIDEEHDGSYKSGNAPRYHARQVAMFRASRKKIPLVMGSATPSVEAWHAMENGSIIRHTLTRRLAGGAVPVISTIDLTKNQPDGCLSAPLVAEIRKTLDAGRQVILFLNRRGFTHFFRCASCGYEITCKNCSVQMTFHKNENRLRCHYCGWSTVPPQSCPSCGSVDIGWSGFGTEYIEAETRAKFPNARIVRVDTDSVTKKGELEEKLDAFRRGEYDIMLGTQMVAKGLNFPALQLVGVVLADTGLHLPDFRAAERTFSLITQVAGRAGRFFPDGRVLVQTYSPLREPIECACKGETEKFYSNEIAQREMLDFPPFTRLVRLVFRSASQKAASETAADASRILQEASKKFRGENAVLVLGPAECPLVKVASNFRYQILLKGKSIAVLQELARTLVDGYTHPQNVYIEVDVDAVNNL